jgi:hypothetical protein
MSSHRVSVVLPRALRLTDRRVQEAKELYAPSGLELEQHGGAEGVPRRQSADAKVEVDDDDGLLVRRAERRVGKKALVLKAKLESGCSCLVGQAVRIRGTWPFPRSPWRSFGLTPAHPQTTSEGEERHTQDCLPRQSLLGRYAHAGWPQPCDSLSLLGTSPYQIFVCLYTQSAKRKAAMWSRCALPPTERGEGRSGSSTQVGFCFFCVPRGKAWWRSTCRAACSPWWARAHTQGT